MANPGLDRRDSQCSDASSSLYHSTRESISSIASAASETDTLRPSETTALLAPQRSSSGESRLRKAFSSRHLRQRSAALGDLIPGPTHLEPPYTPLLRDSSSGSSFPLQSENVRGGYDHEFRSALGGESGNGVRVWYNSFTTIDWLHDEIKDGLRLRHLRNLRGLRGKADRAWDRLQGWVVVTLIGLLAAFFANAIVRSEMTLWDYKSGYCSRGWTIPRRFCCPEQRMDDKLRIFGGSVFQTWSRKSEECALFITWESILLDRFDGNTSKAWWAQHLLFIAIAILFSTLASMLTVYLTSSDNVWSKKDKIAIQQVQVSKDSPFTPFASRRPSTQVYEPRSVVASPMAADFTPRARERSYGTLPRSSSRSTTRMISPTMEQVPHRGKEQEFIAESSPPSPPKRKTMYYAGGSGIPEIKTILSGAVIRGYLGSWVLFVKSFGLALSVGSGLNLGKEGPLVHVASCIGNIVSRFFTKYDTNEARRREILSAACAAGVSVSFGAPIGGVLFSLEEVSYYFPPRVMWRSFFCAMIAAVTLRFFNPYGTGKIVLFEVTYDRTYAFAELLAFAFLGIFGGLYGALFNKANIWWTKNVRNGTSLGRHPIIEVMLVTLVTVIVCFANTFTRMGGTELVYELFSECHPTESFSGLCIKHPSQALKLMKHLGVALIVKGLLTVTTFGIRVPAGIFIPSLAAGALFGRLCGVLVEFAFAHYPSSPVFDFCRTAGENGHFGQACVLPGVWAMVGAAATLAGVTRTTVSLAVIMFELTASLSYVVPVMVAVLVAKTVADAFEHKSIYDLVITAAGLPFLESKSTVVFDHDTPADILDHDSPVIYLNEVNTVASLRKKLQEGAESSATGFPLLTDAQSSKVRGYIGVNELEHALINYLGPLSEEESHNTALLNPTQVACTFKIDNTVPNSVYLFENKLDLTYLTDRAPLTIGLHSPLELIQELFTKLGVRYLIIVEDGKYCGVIEKIRWMAYLKWLEEHQDRQRQDDITNSVL